MKLSDDNFNRIDSELRQVEDYIHSLEAVMRVVTDGKKLAPYHFQTWAGALEEEQRYESRLTQWLKKVAEALEALDA